MSRQNAPRPLWTIDQVVVPKLVVVHSANLVLSALVLILAMSRWFKLRGRFQVSNVVAALTPFTADIVYFLLFFRVVSVKAGEIARTFPPMLIPLQTSALSSIRFGVFSSKGIVKWYSPTRAKYLASYIYLQGLVSIVLLSFTFAQQSHLEQYEPFPWRGLIITIQVASNVALDLFFMIWTFVLVSGIRHQILVSGGLVDFQSASLAMEDANSQHTSSLCKRDIKSTTASSLPPPHVLSSSVHSSSADSPTSGTRHLLQPKSPDGTLSRQTPSPSPSSASPPPQARHEPQHSSLRPIVYRPGPPPSTVFETITRRTSSNATAMSDIMWLKGGTQRQQAKIKRFQTYSLRVLGAIGSMVLLTIAGFLCFALGSYSSDWLFMHELSSFLSRVYLACAILQWSWVLEIAR